MTQVVEAQRIATPEVTHTLPRAAFLTDLGVSALAVTIAFLGRSSMPFLQSAPGLWTDLLVGGPLVVAVTLGFIAAFGGYGREQFGPGTDQFRRIVNAGLAAAGTVGIGCYLVELDLSRGLFLLAFGLGVPGLLLGRYVLRRFVFAARRRGHLRQTVLISGTPGHVDEIARTLRRESWLGYEVLGALTPASYGGPETPGGVPVLGSSDGVYGAVAAVELIEPDVLLLADGASGSNLRSTVWALETSQTTVIVAPSVADISRQRIKMRPVAGLPLIHIEKPRTLRASRSAKRVFDATVASLLILLFLPILVLAALCVWVHDRGPVLFSHTRIGKDGTPFRCLKFRTMVVDAEARMAALRDETASSALLFKLKDDPRITGPGTWLRRFSLDELPQLFNVVRGDMSLVGPRPQVADEVALYAGGMERRLLVRPGMTGLWQVSGRSDLSAEEAVRLDLFYVDNWSMLQDLSILMRTFGAVTGSRGAY